MTSTSTTLISERPALAEPASWDYPVISRRTLASGLEVISCHTPGRPFAIASLVFEGGALGEPPELSGVTGLMAGNLNRATEKHDYLELGLALEALGAGIGGGAGQHSISVGIDAPVWNFNEAFGYLVDIVHTPAFPADEIDRNLEAMRTGLAVRHHNPELLAGYTLHHSIFTDDTVYRRDTGGTWESVGLLNRDRIVDTYRALLGSASATLIVAGDLDTIDVDSLADSLGTSWPEPGQRDTPVVGARREGRRIILIDRPGSPSSIINAGHAGPARRIDDHIPLGTFTHIFGGSPESRLNKILREEKGYTYGVGAGFNRWRHGGAFAVGTAVQNDATGPALAEILKQVELAREGTITADEVEETRESMLGSFPFPFQDVHGLGGLMGAIIEDDLPLNHLAESYEKLISHTVDDVNAVAAKYLDPDNLTFVVVGDASVVAAELEATGAGPVDVIQPTDVFPEPPAPE